jgi:iron complex outermembrane recepter protein
VFASYGYGFRSGGFNSTGSAATIAVLRATAARRRCAWAPRAGPNGPVFRRRAAANVVRNITDVNDDFEQGSVEGRRTRLQVVPPRPHAELNAAVFHTTVDDMQFFNFFAGPFGLLRVVTNIDEVTIQGAELDARWRINEMFTVFARLRVTSTARSTSTPAVRTPKGNEVPYAPEYTANLGVE